MKRRLLFHCFCLALLVSCSKKDAEPAPSLEGNWAVQTLARTTTYLDGSIGKLLPYSIQGQQRMVITADSMFVFQRDYTGPTPQSEVRINADAYTRQGNTLHLDGRPLIRGLRDVEIKELTKTSITLLYVYIPSSNNPIFVRQESEYTYSR